jgi:hypothetical protein
MKSLGQCTENRKITQEVAIPDWVLEVSSGIGLSRSVKSLATRLSLLESKEKIEPDILEQVASILHVPIEAIKNFSEEAAINIISSTLHDNAGSVNNNCELTFNPIEKWVESLEENRRLYESLLKTEREKNALLERMLKEKE